MRKEKREEEILDSVACSDSPRKAISSAMMFGAGQAFSALLVFVIGAFENQKGKSLSLPLASFSLPFLPSHGFPR